MIFYMNIIEWRIYFIYKYLREGVIKMAQYREKIFYIAGLSKVFDIKNINVIKYPMASNDFEANSNDFEALRNDVNEVGKDIWRASDNYGKIYAR